MKTPQYELSNAAEAFNLAPEVGVDPDRVIKERLDAAIAASERRDYELRMQRTFKDCPGFIGSDDPEHVVVEPALAVEAFVWLKRRFAVNEQVELSTDTGLVIEVRARSRRRSPLGQRRSRVNFAPAEQFKLAL